MMMRVVFWVALSGPTRNLSICEQRDSCPTSGRSFKTSRALVENIDIDTMLEGKGWEDHLEIVAGLEVS